MNPAAALIDGFDTLLAIISTKLKQHLCDYVDIETANDPYTLVGVDGSLVSIIKMNGVRGLVGPENFTPDIQRPLGRSLSSYMSSKNHSIQVWFSIDSDRIEDEIRETLSSAFRTAKHLRLDANDILEERIRNLSRYCSVEESYLVLWTNPSALSSVERKKDRSKQKERRESANISNHKSPKTSQDVFASLDSLRDRHNSFVGAVEQDFGQVGISVKKMDVRKALRASRKSIDAGFTSQDWEPRLPGDKILPTKQRIWRSGMEEWDLQWPRIGEQLCPRDAELLDANTISIGDKIFAPIYMHLAPKDIERFDSLFGKLLNQENIPWRISYAISGDGLSAMTWKKLGVGLLKQFSDDNKLISAGLEELNQLKMAHQETIVKLQVCLTTWADKDQIELVEKRRQVLARAVEGWGGCEVSESTGDPIAGFMSTALGISTKSIGTETAAPLEDVIRMLPLSRPSSAWDRGAVLFRSPDGKILPFQPGSSKQSTWISLAFARPGSGKSVLMNVINFALCLNDGLKKLPRMAIIDIGPSSSGLVSLIKEALPPDQKHLAVYERLKNSKEQAINCFDTQRGVRFPTSPHRAFLMNLVGLLVTDPSRDEPEEGLSGLIMDVLDEAYRQKSDNGNPKKFAMHIDHEIDEAIKKYRIQTDIKTTWWEIVDALFDHGEIRLSGIAQRHAVPLLSDLSAIANTEKFTSKYTFNFKSTGENVIKGFSRLISNAQDMYPLLAYPTSFDLGDARIISLDLDEVARGGGPIGDRQTQIMYMIARQVVSGDFYLNMDDLKMFPAPPEYEIPKTCPVLKYKAYHQTRIEEMKEELKRICYDEFHRTSGSSAVRKQVLLDMREGRKWNVDIMLLSQSIEDFDQEMINFATAIYIMDPGNEENLNNLTKKFGLKKSEVFALKHQVHGPKEEGVTFLSKFTTLDGDYTSLLTLTVGAMEMWALNTTVESVAIRKRLYERVGPKKARRILARAFPKGSAKSYVEDRKANMKSKIGYVDEKAEENIYDLIVEETIKTYGREFVE